MDWVAGWLGLLGDALCIEMAVRAEKTLHGLSIRGVASGMAAALSGALSVAVLAFAVSRFGVNVDGADFFGGFVVGLVLLLATRDRMARPNC